MSSDTTTVIRAEGRTGRKVIRTVANGQIFVVSLKNTVFQDVADVDLTGNNTDFKFPPLDSP